MAARAYCVRSKRRKNNLLQCGNKVFFEKKLRGKFAEMEVLPVKFSCDPHWVFGEKIPLKKGAADEGSRLSKANA
jgi:hypothetical protein